MHERQAIALSSGPFLDLPTELHLKIFMHCVDYRSAVALRLVSRRLNAIYADNETRILTSIAKQLVAPVAEFYDFLVRLRLPVNSVLHPPPSGWPNITPEACTGYNKTPFAITVLKHLSYISDSDQYSQNECNVGYKSECVDYSAFGQDRFAKYDFEVFWATQWQNGMDQPWEPFGEEVRIPPLKHIVMLAEGYESGGVVLLLDTWNGTVYEEIVRSDNGIRQPVAEYCASRIESCTSLEEVFLPFADPLGGLLDYYDAEEMERKGEPYPDEDDTNEDEQVAWARHLYRKFGWPGNKYDKEGCMKALEEFMDRWES